MTNQETTLVPIRKRFDEEGRPKCGNCPFLNDYGTICRAAPKDEYRFSPGPKCPVHFPREGTESL